ncbi:PAS domain S-box protein [Desulfoferrobacter suflitae]|uniref:PAS domain S-box protein n=1 Tax=Desulfoferrobacter suflitae TaxID=2865782 RepID=UPI002164598D|nr:PAS domain S-box protein [Desulfoferrobacter suflitae]MCK8604031.1 PAS domain S-box protein [Desulfoferrobacter suflitae]
MSDQNGSANQETRVHHLEQELRELRDEAVRLQDELNTTRALYAFVSALGTSPSLGESLQLIADKIREFFGAVGSCLACLDAEAKNLTITACAGNKIEPLRNRWLAASSPQFDGRGEAVIFEADVAGDDPIAGQIIGGANVVSGMRAPLRMGSHCFGYAYVFSEEDIFTGTHLDTFLRLTQHAAAEIQRSRTEQLLRESEERFRFMAETTGDVIYRLRYDSMTYDYLSPGIFNLTGYTRDEIEEYGFGKLILRIDTPSEKNISSQAIIKNRLEGKTREYRADYLLKTKSGELKWIRDHSSPWYDESAVIIGSVGILSDVSEYKRAEERIEQRTVELIESEERYRSLVENVPLVVYRMRPRGHVFFLNQFVEQVFGFTAGEILCNPELWHSRVHGEDQGRVMNLRDASFKEARDFFAEYRIIHKNGHLAYVLDHAVPFYSTDGRISSLDGIIMDMTGRVRLQEQLLRAESLKTISEVSQRLAHEIRNPLVSAGGFARLLLSSMASSDPNREKVEIIVREVGRLESILRMIINYIQPLELKPVPTEVADLLHSVLRKLAGSFEEKCIRTKLQLAAQIPPAAVDPVLMEQALEALVRNAVCHMPTNGRIFFLSMQEDEFAKLCIRYPAEHVSNDDIEHFFYPFTTSHFGPGDSDLPMSKIIITKHGGHVHAAANESSEIILTVSLPLQGSSVPAHLA